MSDERALDVLELLAKAAIALGTIKLFLVGILKPYAEWRKEHTARTIRSVLGPELRQLNDIINKEDGCAKRLESAVATMRELFHDFDDIRQVVHAHNGQHEETNDLLNQVFGIERRMDFEKAEEINSLLVRLGNRADVRRRGLPIVPPEKE
jgi:hypothetical protein